MRYRTIISTIKSVPFVRATLVEGSLRSSFNPIESLRTVSIPYISEYLQSVAGSHVAFPLHCPAL